MAIIASLLIIDFVRSPLTALYRVFPDGSTKEVNLQDESGRIEKPSPALTPSGNKPSGNNRMARPVATPRVTAKPPVNRDTDSPSTTKNSNGAGRTENGDYSHQAPGQSFNYVGQTERNAGEQAGIGSNHVESAGWKAPMPIYITMIRPEAVGSVRYALVALLVICQLQMLLLLSAWTKARAQTLADNGASTPDARQPNASGPIPSTQVITWPSLELSFPATLQQTLQAVHTWHIGMQKNLKSAEDRYNQLLGQIAAVHQSLQSDYASYRDTLKGVGEALPTGNGLSGLQLFGMLKRFAEEQRSELEALRTGVHHVVQALKQFRIASLPLPQQHSAQNVSELETWSRYIDSVRGYLDRQATHIGELMSQLAQQEQKINIQTMAINTVSSYILGDIDELQDDLQILTDKQVERLRASGYRMASVKFLQDAYSDALSLRFMMLLIQRAKPKLSAQEIALLPEDFDSLLALDFYSQLKDDDSITQSLQLTSPLEIDTQNTEMLRQRLRRMLGKDFWRPCALAFAANAYLEQFLYCIDRSGQYVEIISYYKVAVEALRRLLTSLDISPYDISLFRSSFNPILHDPIGVSLYVTSRAAYANHVRSMVQAGEIQTNTVVEVRLWGFESAYPSDFPSAKAKILLFSESLLSPAEYRTGI